MDCNLNNFSLTQRERVTFENKIKISFGCRERSVICRYAEKNSFVRYEGQRIRVTGNFCVGVSRNYEELRASWQLRANNTRTPLN